MADAVVSEVLDLFVPELAVQETVARVQDTAAARQRGIRRELRNWPQDAREHLQAAITASERFAVEYEQLLRERLEQIGAELLAYPTVDHDVIAGRAIRRRAPFDPGGNGYRDALHWHSFLELLESQEPVDPFAYLLSADKKAFGPSRHAQLLEDVEELGTEWNVEFVSSIHDFTVPGQFLEEKGDLSHRQEQQLRSAITSALHAGGWPDDLDSALAARGGFDEARISTVEALSVDAWDVQVERRSGDLWVSFDVSATCLISFESMEIIDEDLGEYTVNRDTRRWDLSLTGTAYSQGEDLNEIASLRLDESLNDPIDTGEQPAEH